MNTSSMDQMSRAQREALLARAKAAKLAKSESARPESIPPRPVNGESQWPTSFAQQRLWLLTRMGEQASAAYHVPIRFSLRGPVQAQALQAALDRIVLRHEVLRTHFELVDGQPLQQIEDQGSFDLRHHDLSQAPDAQAQVAHWSRIEEETAFDLAAGPPARGRLLRLGEHEHVLLLTLHHIVSDGWSMGVLMHELGSLYQAYALDGVAPQTDPLPALPVQYADYAVWQRQWLSTDVQVKQQTYWREQLSGAPALIALPGDRPRPPVQDYAGASLDLELDEDLSEALRALSRKYGTTLYMTLLAVWSALASRLSGQSEVVIGTPVANRTRVEVEPLIGFFVNTLALRLDLSGQPTVAELLAHVREQVLQAQAHQDLPFEQVVEALKPARSLAHTPLFQLMFTWQNAADEVALDIGALRWQTLPEGERRSAQFDLSLGLQDIDGRIVGSLGFATALFDRATMAKHIDYLKALLRGMAADDRQPVERIALMDAAERRDVLEKWNATQRAYPLGRCVHQSFEEQTARTPEAIALEHDGLSLSYAELNASANRLAHRLRALGVGPDLRVALLLERGPQLIVAMLATLKAGGAYVPMDPAYPPERLSYLLSDSAPKAVLTQRHLRDSLSLDDSTQVVELDGDAADWQSLSDENLYTGTVGVTATNLAYVIYTSGSTGQPKGVMVEHANLANLVAWHSETFPLQSGERTASMAGVAFDACTWEIWPALNMGATLALPPGAAAGDPLRLLEWWESQDIHSGFLVTALAEIALGRAQPDKPLRSLLTGGDRLSRLPGRDLPFELINNYGPTETTVVATSGRLSADDRTIHIGRPIANTSIYLLDAHGEPVPQGVAGEIYIGGAGVASGYLNRPELTRERFLDDPFAGRVGARMYRSGDLGRWLPDGTIEFLGRNDHQVKIRGFRIELGEIEAQLIRLPGVSEAVVHAREDNAGDKRLVAYLVGTDLPQAADLRAALARELPDYMVPAAYVALERLPLTHNGKLDRQALPAPEGDAFAQRVYEEPQGAVEIVLAQIWAELLQLPRVGRQDHFFELGGHSLLALQVTARLQQRLGLNVALSDLFAQPVLRDLAQLAAQQQGQALPAVVADERPQVLPMSFAQQRLWFIAQMDEAASAAYHMAGGLRLHGPLDADALQAALDRIVQRHEALRTGFALADGQPIQRIAADARFALVRQDLSASTDPQAELARWTRTEKDAPFDLAAGPLARGRLLRLGEHEHVLLLTLHHIVSDGWSMGVLVKELNALYRAYALDGVSPQLDPLPALPVQYADYALWQRKWLSGELQQKQLGYWREHLSGAPALITLPIDRLRPSIQDYSGASLDLELDEGLSEALRALSRKHGTTLYMTLLAAWGALASRLAGQEEVVIGTPVANRARVEIEPLIGFFVNTLALRLDLSGNPSVGDLLLRVRDRVLRAQAHQDVPFEQVVEALKPARSLAHSPLFQLMFSWQNTPQTALELGALRLQELEQSEHRSAQFDLSLALQEVDGRIVGQLEYATLLFDQDTMSRHLTYLQALLRAMVEDDRQSVEHIAILPQAERQQLLQTWSGTQRAYPHEHSIHALFEQQVARTPDATAVEQGGQTLSYAALNAQANQLARHLRALGVGPDDRVAIAMPRSADLLVALLATLKAGGAYVPMDPAYPPERLSYLLEDSAPKLLLTHSAVRASLPASDALTVMEIDREAAAWQSASADDLDPAATPESLAYVIYTSGSTGQPKGVMIEHRGLCNQIAALQAHYDLGPSDRILQFVSPTFDVSVEEIFTALLSGATLILRTDEWITGPAQWCALCAQHGLTVVNLPTLFWQQLAQAPEVAIPEGLRQIVIGGDTVSPAALQAWWARAGHRPALSNAYGPTENTINTSIADCTPEARPHSIGRPMANTTIYLLDAHGEPVPAGTTGEIHIGGVGVARGYLNRPELTSERFLDDPFAEVAGARMYRTGDLGRWLPDGTIEFLGRNDHQVKIRGFRIELGEIDAQLTKVAGVSEAVVHAREDNPGDKRLVA
ncbi:MAG: amino acid adenylation domain-containing protein, partial [Lysobacter sp.]